MATNNKADVIEDQIEAIKWSCKQSVEIIVVDDGNNLSDLKCTTIKSKGKIHKASSVGFKVNEGIYWAIENGIEFEMAMVLDDDSLPIRKGLDVWAMNELKKDKIGLLGVKDDKIACGLYSSEKAKKAMMKKLKQWIDVPEGWEPPNENVFYAVNFQPSSLILKMKEKGMLSADKEEWPRPCETFQAWMTELFGFKQKFWGEYPNNLIPPLYSMHHGTKSPKDPRFIQPEFMIHHSIRNVKGISEWEIRKHFKKMRNQKML